MGALMVPVGPCWVVSLESEVLEGKLETFDSRSDSLFFKLFRSKTVEIVTVGVDAGSVVIDVASEGEDVHGDVMDVVICKFSVFIKRFNGLNSFEKFLDAVKHSWQPGVCGCHLRSEVTCSCKS